MREITSGVFNVVEWSVFQHPIMNIFHYILIMAKVKIAKPCRKVLTISSLDVGVSLMRSWYPCCAARTWNHAGSTLPLSVRTTYKSLCMYLLTKFSRNASLHWKDDLIFSLKFTFLCKYITIISELKVHTYLRITHEYPWLWGDW